VIWRLRKKGDRPNQARKPRKLRNQPGARIRYACQIEKWIGNVIGVPIGVVIELQIVETIEVDTIDTTDTTDMIDMNGTRIEGIVM
jgi:hypothetical protein